MLGSHWAVGALTAPTYQLEAESVEDRMKEMIRNYRSLIPREEGSLWPSSVALKSIGDGNSTATWSLVPVTLLGSRTGEVKPGVLGQYSHMQRGSSPTRDQQLRDQSPAHGKQHRSIGVRPDPQLV